MRRVGFFVRNAMFEDVDALVSMYNVATQKLMEKGIHQWYYPWRRSVIEEMLSTVVVLLKDQQLVGAMMITGIERVDEESEDMESLYIEKLVIHPAFQGQRMSKRLFDYARKLGREQKQAVYFDCWAGNTRLIDYYLNEAEQIAVVDEDEYQVAVFRLN